MELHYVSVPYEGNYDAIAKKLRVTEDFEDEFREIFDACAAVARPKAVFGLRPVAHEEGGTRVGEALFKSQIMRVNFQDVHRAFPYVATCGQELYQLSQAAEDPLERYWIDIFSEFALGEAHRALHKAVRETYGLGKFNSMNPGSLADFPISCQRPLFDLLGEGPERIGLTLTPTFLMLPHKSGSGIFYESEKTFVNCSLCPRVNCPGRRAPYNEALRAEYGLEGE